MGKLPRGLPKSYIKRWGISKLAWRKFRQGALTKAIKTRTKAIKKRIKGATRRRSNPRKRGGRRTMARRRKKRRGGKSMTRTAFKLIRLGALVAGGVGVGMRYHDTQDKVIGGLLGYGGCDWKGRVPKFSWSILAQAWTPYIASCFTTYGIPKLVNIIRRL